MTDSFVRCPYCGSQHLANDEVCAVTGRPLKHTPEPATLAAVNPPPPVAKPVSARGADRAPRSRRIVLRPDPKDAPVSPKGAQKKPSEESLIGMLIDGKYQVTGLVGAGGMGKVYEAEHVALGRHVALKVLHGMLLKQQDAVARFHREARAASSVGHPNICEVYDVGYLPDLSPYMVMELLHGIALSDRLEREGSLPVQDVIDTTTQILSALVAAHNKGIIHRDIKPENVFLAERVGCPPLVKLLDFGIVKAKDDSLELTHAGTIVGTPFYMAPELIRGDPYDHRIDLFAVGVMMFEMLTGLLPFEAENYFELAQQILHIEHPDVTDLRPELSVSWLPVLDKALAKDPAKRYRHAKDFLAGLEDLKVGLSLRRSSIYSAPPVAEDTLLVETEEVMGSSVEIPVVQSVREEDLVVAEGVPDTMYDPEAHVAQVRLGEPTPAWDDAEEVYSSAIKRLSVPPPAPAETPASEQADTPLLERWERSTSPEPEPPKVVSKSVERSQEQNAGAGVEKPAEDPQKGKKHLDSTPPGTMRSSTIPREPKEKS